MVGNPSVTFSDPKLLAGLYSNASLRSLYKGRGRSSGLIDSLQSMVNGGVKGQTLGALLDLGFKELLRNYRHEYLFKSVLFKDFVLEKYVLESAILLNEFKIGSSIADAVLVNGTNKVFEIKTELDSPARLDSQLKDYKKAFSEIYLVVHHTQVEKYATVVSSEIGLLGFSEADGFSECRIASPDLSQLDVVAMAKTLRKDELSSLVVRLAGTAPDATPVKLFATCLAIIKGFPAEQVQNEFLQIIKERIDSQLNDRILANQVPDFLKFFCYTENIKEKDYIHLLDSLNITL